MQEYHWTTIRPLLRQPLGPPIPPSTHRCCSRHRRSPAGSGRSPWCAHTWLHSGTRTAACSWARTSPRGTLHKQKQSHPCLAGREQSTGVTRNAPQGDVLGMAAAPVQRGAKLNQQSTSEQPRGSRVQPHRDPTKHGAGRSGLTQLAGWPVVARGADAGTGDRVAILGGSRALAALAAALPKGAGWAGCERGQQGNTGTVSAPPAPRGLGFPFFYF